MTEEIVYSGRHLFDHEFDAIYGALRHLKPGLCLDVGAAAGVMTSRMLAESPESRVIAFEPFPGNHGYFQDKLGADTRVRLVREAVGGEAGEVVFNVASVIENGSGAWAGLDGYSSVGFVKPEPSELGARDIKVRQCALDDIVKEKALFLKIDVQGYEYEVLRGAAQLIDNWGVDFMQVEFMGDPRVLEFLWRRDYVVYDSEYQLIASRAGADLVGWDVVTRSRLSTGAESAFGWPEKAPRSGRAFADYVEAERRRIGHVQTDLVAISRSVLDEVVGAIKKARQSHLSGK